MEVRSYVAEAGSWGHATGDWPKRREEESGGTTIGRRVSGRTRQKRLQRPTRRADREELRAISSIRVVWTGLLRGAGLDNVHKKFPDFKPPPANPRAPDALDVWLRQAQSSFMTEPAEVILMILVINKIR